MRLLVKQEPLSRGNEQQGRCKDGKIPTARHCTEGIFEGTLEHRGRNMLIYGGSEEEKGREYFVRLSFLAVRKHKYG